MSLKSCFPRIWELEHQYGGLLRAMMRLAKQKKAERKAGKQVASAAGPGGVLTSFRGGIQELTAAVVASLDGEVRTGCGVDAILPKKSGFELHLEEGGILDAEAVVSAVPAHALAGMVEDNSRTMAELLRQIPYAPLCVVCFGYRREQIDRDLDGFGYLIPKKEGRHTLGTLWDSSIFENRAPEGRVLLRSMIGGATNPGVVDLHEEEIKERVSDDLARIMGIKTPPEFIRVFPHERAIPQYTVGHAGRVAALQSEAEKFPGLFLTGNAFFGVGLNDCVHAANQCAAQVVDFLQQRQTENPSA